ALERAAFLLLGGDAGLAEDGGGERSGGAERRGATHESTPREPALLDLRSPIFQVGHFVPPMHVANAWLFPMQPSVLPRKSAYRSSIPRLASTKTSTVPAG